MCVCVRAWLSLIILVVSRALCPGLIDICSVLVHACTCTCTYCTCVLVSVFLLCLYVVLRMRIIWHFLKTQRHSSHTVVCSYLSRKVRATNLAVSPSHSALPLDGVRLRVIVCCLSVVPTTPPLPTLTR